MTARCFLIVGMDRSGTSALTRVISLTGADLPSDLVPPHASNVTGHWEPRPIVDIHDRLRENLGQIWNDYIPLPEGWFDHPATKTAREQILQHLRADFASSSSFVIKDPRLCLFAPLWLDLLKEFGAEPYVIFCFRQPLEVAASLKRRGDVPWDISLPRWLNSNVEAAIATRHVPRAFTSYDDLLTDWKSTLDRIQRDLGIQWRRTLDEIEPEVNDFLSPEHRHHVQIPYEQVDNEALRIQLKNVYEALQNACHSGTDSLEAAIPPAQAYLKELYESPREEVMRYERERFKVARRRARELESKLQKARERRRRLRRRLHKQRRSGIALMILIALLAALAGWILGRIQTSGPVSAAGAHSAWHAMSHSRLKASPESLEPRAVRTTATSMIGAIKSPRGRAA
jgi:hypothetical protein